MYRNEDKFRAIQLRNAGKSYNEIRKILNIKSKGTLSLWFRDIQLTPEARELLKENIDKATHRKLLAFNKERSQRIVDENLEARYEGRSLIGKLSKQDLLILGTALYWGEGTKSEAKQKYHPVVLTNSDPCLIKMFLRFLREILLVPEDKIRGAIHIYEGIDPREAREFWAECAGIPTERFTISYQISKAGKGKRNTLPYGTVKIFVSSRLLFNKIKGMIEGLIQY